MKPWTFLLMIALPITGWSCGGSTTNSLVLRDATVTANAAANTIETLQALALVIYRTEQEIAIQTAMNLGETKAQAKGRVVIIRARWAQLWSKFEDARSVHSALAALLQTQALNSSAIQTTAAELDLRVRGIQSDISAASKRIVGGVQ